MISVLRMWDVSSLLIMHLATITMFVLKMTPVEATHANRELPSIAMTPILAPWMVALTPEVVRIITFRLPAASAGRILFVPVEQLHLQQQAVFLTYGPARVDSVQPMP